MTHSWLRLIAMMRFRAVAPRSPTWEDAFHLSIFKRFHPLETMFPAISESDLLALPIPAIATRVQTHVHRAVCQSAQARQRAIGLLDAAKHAVEFAIEDSKAAPLAHLTAANPPAIPA